MEISLIENIQREDLNPIEEAQAYEALISEYNLKQEEVAERVSKAGLPSLTLCDFSSYVKTSGRWLCTT